MRFKKGDWRSLLVLVSLVMLVLVLYGFASEEGQEFSVQEDIAICRDLGTEGTTYVLTANVSRDGTCFNVTAPNIVLDCAGFEIGYNTVTATGHGVQTNQDNFTLKDCFIEGKTNEANSYSIYLLSGATKNHILNNTIYPWGNRGKAIYLLAGAEYNIIANNTAPLISQFATEGIECRGDHNVFLNNTFVSTATANTGVGSYTFFLNGVTNCTLRYNRMNASATGLNYYVDASNSADYSHSIDTTNLAHGLPVNYTNSSDNLAWDRQPLDDYGLVIVADSENLSITNSNFTHNNLHLTAVSNSRIVNNTFNASYGSGLMLYSTSENNTIENNIFYGRATPYEGLLFLGGSADNNRINNNTFEISANVKAIHAQGVSSPNITRNNITVTTGSGNPIKTSQALTPHIEHNVINTQTSIGSILLSYSGNTAAVINNNTITSTASSTTFAGITIQASAIGTVISNNTVFMTGSSASALYLTNDVLNLNIYGNNFTATGATAYALYVNIDVVTANFRDNIIHSVQTTDIYTDTDTDVGSWLNFTNTTFSEYSINDIMEINSSWYLDVKANNTVGTNLGNINVSAWDQNNVYRAVNFTNESGDGRLILQQYTLDETSRINYGNYSVNASKATFGEVVNVSLNVTANTNYTFTFDGDAPTINFTDPTPAQGNYSRNWIYANITSTDDRLNNLSIWLYNSTHNLINSTINSSSPWGINFTELSDGIYYLNATANDTNQNTNASETRTIILDVTGATVPSNITPVNRTFTNDTDLNFTGNFSDPTAGLSNASLYIYNDTGLYNKTTITFTGAPFSYLGGIVVTLVDNAYTWFWEVIDTLNNVGVSENKTVIFDSTYPLINFTEPTKSNGSGTTGMYNINVSITDKNLANVTYHWDGVEYGVNYTPKDLMYDMVFLMNFDNLSDYAENDTYVYDYSGFENNGTSTNNVRYNASGGKYGGGFSFDRVNTGLAFDSGAPIVDLNLTKNFTMAFWVYPYSLDASDNHILRWRKDTSNFMSIGFNDATNIKMISQYEGVTSQLQYNININDYLNKWSHFVFSYNESNMSFYIDGSLVKTAGLISDGTDKGSFWIGRSFDGFKEFNGSLDELVMWERTLSPNEIKFLYNTSLKKYPDLNMYYLKHDPVSSVNLTLYSNDSLNENWTLYVNQSGIVLGNSYKYNVTARDWIGNLNSTDTRVIRGNAPPHFLINTYTPNSTDGLDPNVTILIDVNVSDSDNNLEFAILEWKNHTDTGWVNNISLTNISAKGIQTRYNASFNFTYEGNFTFRVWANDTEGSINTSAETLLETWYDCTWVYSHTDMSSTAGFSENKYLGNITFNNTGDSDHTNCELKFRMTHNLAEGRIYYDTVNIKPSDVYVLDPGENQSVTINGTFLTSTAEDDFDITLTEYLSRSNMTDGKNISGTLVTTTGGPYLYQSFVSPPSSLSLTVDNYTLSSYIRNLVGDTYPAYNVSFNWTLPIDFIIQNVGNGTSNYTNISNTSLNYNNIIVEFNATNLPDLKPITYNITITALGYNSTGSLIAHANNETLLTSSTEVTLVCNDVSDGVCPLYCGNTADPDCTSAALSLSPGGGAGGAAGGGGGGSGLSAAEKEKLFQTEEEYELIRGESNMFVLVAENPFIHPITDVTLEISGFFGKYMSVNPRTIAKIPEKGEGMFNITIKSPKYFTKGNYELNFTMTGFVNKSTQAYEKSVPFTGSIFVILSIHELSAGDAEKFLVDSGDLVRELKNKKLNVERLELLVEQAKYSLEQDDYEGVKLIYDEILENHESALGALEIIEEIDAGIDDAIHRGLKIPDTQRLMVLVKAAMERGDFITAFERADDAKVTFALETVGRFNLIAYVQNNFVQLIAMGLIIFVVSYVLWLVIKWRFSIKKLKMLRKEENILLGLIREIQKECFELGKMSMREYGISLVEYEKKMNKVIRNLVLYETMRINVFKLFKNKSLRLEEEKGRLINLIKETQEAYMGSGKLDTRIYEYRMKSYAERMVEIEEKLASMEAKKAIKEIKK